MSSREFDREKTGVYSFEVYAIDGGLYGPRSQSVRVEITIDDVNDNSPVFEEIPYKAEISQDHGVNHYVLKVTAVDKDIGSNGQVTYSLREPSRYFRIDGESGEITTKSLLADPSAIMVHRLEVIARDGGDSPRYSTGTDIALGWSSKYYSI